MLECAGCGKEIKKSEYYFEILDNGYVVNAYRNVHKSVNLTKFCSKECILEHLHVEEIRKN